MDTEKNKKSIGLIHSLGGCGGTLLAQCLGALKDVVLLSECNPLSACLFDLKLNPYVQISQWHPELFSIVENEFTAEDLQNPEIFCQFITKIKLFLDSKNKNLIIRDYNYMDYFGVPFLDKPPMYASLLKALGSTFHKRQVLLIRHPLTQYNSLRSHDILKDVLSPELFLKGYFAFLHDFKGCKMIKYEDIVSQPENLISGLSHFLNIPFSNDFINTFHSNQSVTGNFKRVGENKISLSTQQIMDDKWTKQLRNHSEFKSLLTKLTYEVELPA